MVGQLAMLSLAENAQLADEAGDQHEALLCAYAIGIIFAMGMGYGFYVTFSAAETILGENALAVLEEAQAKATETIEPKLRDELESQGIEFDQLRPVAQAEFRKMDNLGMLKRRLQQCQKDPKGFIEELKETFNEARSQLQLFDIEGEFAPSDLQIDLSSVASCKDMVRDGKGGLLLSNLMHTGHFGEMAILMGAHDYGFIKLHNHVLALAKQGDAMAVICLRDVHDKTVWMRKDILGNVALHYATSYDIVRVLLEKEPKATQVRNYAGETPFGYMSRMGVPFGVAKGVVLKRGDEGEVVLRKSFFEQDSGIGERCVE